MSFHLGTASAKIRRSRSESHSDAYDADDGEELFIPRHVKNGIFLIKTSRCEIISLKITLKCKEAYLYALNSFSSL